MDFFLGLHCCLTEKSVMKWELYQNKKFSFHIFNSGTKEAADNPKKWAPFRSKSPMTMTHPFFYMEATLMQGAVWINLQPSEQPPLLFGSTCRDSHLLSQGPWDSGIITQETCLLCWARALCHCPLSLHPCVQPDGEMTESSLSCVLSAYGMCPRKARCNFSAYVVLKLHSSVFFIWI